MPMCTTLPAGKYFIGDPCYVFDQDWDDIVDLIFGTADTLIHNGRQLFVATTAYGDGSYRGSNGFEFGVDAGLLGAVPVELMSKTPGPKDGVIIDAPHGLVCSEPVYGCFVFKVVNGTTIEIDTDFHDDETDEDLDD